MGNFYNIFVNDEDAIYERGDTNYYEIKIKNKECDAVTDPSTCSITITDPCGTVLVDEVAMTNSSTGIYYHPYAISDTAAYGKYEITVETSSPTYKTIFKDRFYILPWNAIQDVRSLSGIKSKKSISNHDIADIIWKSYQKVLSKVFEYHHMVTPLCNPDTGDWIDGVNTTFKTSNGPIADRNGDGSVTGFGELSCGTDINGWWRDEDGNCKRVKITINEYHCGNITITQLDGTAIPSNAEWVRISYWSEWETYDEDMMREAVAYLAAHTCIVRFKELDKATQADLYSTKQAILDDKARMWNEYKKRLRDISKPQIGAGMLPGEGQTNGV